MGTNFYLEYWGGSDHIGKRSAAGLFCWDCNMTLCRGGSDDIHFSKSGWYEKCPICGKEVENEDLDNSSTGRELGFNKGPKRKTGVKSCSSFTWAVKPDDLYGLYDEFRIVDEYGRKYSETEFEAVLEECPIRFYDSIGQEFS